jgi:hypothetical protein
MELAASDGVDPVFRLVGIVVVEEHPFPPERPAW